MRNHPLVVNFFAGPGAGKSTLAAMVFAELKRIGSPLAIELTTEFAKDLVWEGRIEALRNQIYVLGNQFQRIQRVVGSCDVVITDSPVLLSAIYKQPHYPDSLIDLALWAFRLYPSYNVFVERHDAPYEEHGRFQTEEQAREIDARILDFLQDNGVSPIHFAKPAHEDARVIVDAILNRMIDGQGDNEAAA